MGFALLILLFSFLSLLAGGGSLLWRLALKKIGVHVTGKVVSLREDDGVYYPTIQYRTPEGEVQYYCPGNSSAYKDLLDQEVPVIYDPENPQQITFLHKSHEIESIVFACVGAALLVVGLFLFWWTAVHLR